MKNQEQFVRICRECLIYRLSIMTIVRQKAQLTSPKQNIKAIKIKFVKYQKQKKYNISILWLIYLCCSAILSKLYCFSSTSKSAKSSDSTS